MKNVKFLIIGLAAFLFLGASCSTTTTVNTNVLDVNSDTNANGSDDIELDEYPVNTPFTPHNSPILLTTHVDQALEGTWTLESEVVVGQTNPFAGRTLTIDELGNFTEDYSTELSANAPDCTVSGSSAGRLRNQLDVDIDAYDQAVADAGGDESLVDVADYQIAYFNVIRDTAGNREISCEGSDVTVTSTATTSPLGTGPAISGDWDQDGTSGEMFVQYTYTMNNSWDRLVTTGSSVIYTFVK